RCSRARAGHRRASDIVLRMLVVPAYIAVTCDCGAGGCNLRCGRFEERPDALWSLSLHDFATREDGNEPSNPISPNGTRLEVQTCLLAIQKGRRRQRGTERRDLFLSLACRSGGAHRAGNYFHHRPWRRAPTRTLTEIL